MPNGVVSLPPDSAGDIATRDNGTDTERQLYRWSETHPQACDPQYVDRVFYNEVICTMITTMEPLSMNPSNGIDDIIVTGYALQMVDPSADPNAGDPNKQWVAVPPIVPLPMMSHR